VKWRMLEEKLEGKKWKEVEILWLTEDGEEVVAVAEGREGTYCPSLDFGEGRCTAVAWGSGRTGRCASTWRPC